MTGQGSPAKFIPAPPSPTVSVPEFRALIEDRPVVLAELPDGSTAWLVSGYEQARQMAADPRFSRALAVSSERALVALRSKTPTLSRQGFEALAGSTINGIDPPEHTRLRKLVVSAFTARRIQALRPRVASIVDELIDALLDKPQPADLVAAFSLPLPVRVICEMLGVPTEDMEKFHVWSGRAMGDWERNSEDVMTALAEMFGYFGKLIEMKRAQPADDLMTALIASRDQADRLSDEELMVMGCTLLIAGHEATVNQINLSLLALLDHPDELAKLRAKPDLIPGAVEEFLRYVRLGGLPAARVTREEVQIGDVTIPAGQTVIPLFGTANRDPSVFTDPDRFDVTRAPAASHLSFGVGVHHCLGAQLARLELQEAFRGLLGRVPGLRLAVPAEELRFKHGMAVHSLCDLPVTWDQPMVPPAAASAGSIARR